MSSSGLGGDFWKLPEGRDGTVCGRVSVGKGAGGSQKA